MSLPHQSDHDLLTTREAAAVLGVGTTSIKRWADQGLLPHIKTPGGHRRFSRLAVEALRAAPAAPAPVPSDRTDAWIRTLTERAPVRSTRDMLEAERREHGSWRAAADAMQAVLDELGERWSRGDVTVVQEHIASERLARAGAAAAATIAVPDGAPRILLMAAEGDDHTLGLSLAELCFREAGWRVTWAGRKTPIHFAAQYAATAGLAGLAVSASSYSQDRATLADQADRLGAVCRAHGVALILGGRGAWPARPTHGHRVRTFAELDELLASRGSGP